MVEKAEATTFVPRTIAQLLKLKQHELGLPDKKMAEKFGMERSFFNQIARGKKIPSHRYDIIIGQVCDLTDEAVVELRENSIVVREREEDRASYGPVVGAILVRAAEGPLNPVEVEILHSVIAYGRLPRGPEE